MEISCAAPVRGRPREFCTEAALAAALGVFWTKGYEGASMAELTEAMGITKPSLYAAFGNKEHLFQKALDLYERDKLAYTREAMEQPTGLAVVEYFLRGAVDAQTGATTPRGCLGVVTASACGAEAQSIKADIIQRRKSSAAALIERFNQAKAAGDMPAWVDPEAMARLLFAIMQGMAVQASSGATRAELDKIVDLALAIWPSA